ncbi:hypothetical protein FRC10_008711, partial [Ceratobasidium sp. 414]
MSLWSIKPLVSRLEKIHLCIDPQGPAEPGLIERWPGDFLLQVCDSSPQISDMLVHFSDTDGDEDETPVSASPHVLEVLAQLPLKSLSLGNISF